MLEEEGKVDLARAGLVAPGHVGELQVIDPRQEPLDGRSEIALQGLHVEEVVLQGSVRRPDFLEDGGGLRAAREKAAGHRPGAQRLDHEPHALAAEPRGRIAEVGDVRFVERAAIDPGRHDTGHAMQPPASRGPRVGDGALEVLAKARFAPRQAGRAVLAALRVAARHVVQHDLDPGFTGSLPHVFRRDFVRILVLDRAEAGPGGRREALEEADLAKERRNVRCEPGHYASIARIMLDAMPWWAWPILLFVVTFVLGVVSVVAGIGGGVLFVPIVGSFFPFHLDFVRGAGLVLALAGTLAAGPLLLRAQLASLRLVMPLALAGSIASLAGAVLGLALSTELVQTALGVVVIAVAFLIWRSKGADAASEPDALGEALRLEGRYLDPAAHMVIDWRTHRTAAGIASFAGIGFLGGVFGLGAGFANVPALNLLMGAPLKVAVGSSGLVISVINSSAAWVYINRGALLPLIAVPSILGVMLGSRIGARLLRVTPASVVRRAVIVVMLIAGSRALLRGLGLWT